jgi:hypothetical protein
MVIVAVASLAPGSGVRALGRGVRALALAGQPITTAANTRRIPAQHRLVADCFTVRRLVLIGVTAGRGGLPRLPAGDTALGWNTAQQVEEGHDPQHVNALVDPGLPVPVGAGLDVRHRRQSLIRRQRVPAQASGTRRLTPQPDSGILPLGGLTAPGRPAGIHRAHGQRRQPLQRRPGLAVLQPGEDHVLGPRQLRRILQEISLINDHPHPRGIQAPCIQRLSNLGKPVLQCPRQVQQLSCRRQRDP